MKCLNIALIFSISLLVACKSKDAKSEESDTHFVVAKESAPQALLGKIPSLAAYAKLIEGSLNQKPPVLPLDESELKDPNQSKAQLLALRDKEFLRDVYHKDSGDPLRNEIMSVRLVQPGELPAGVSCSEGSCYRVFLYHYYSNSASIAFVDVTGGKVVAVKRQIDVKAELNQRLHALAIEIALHSDEVQDVLGIKAEELEETRKELEISMVETKCERSKHLCTGPVFYSEKLNRTVWTIVDLTDWKLIGLVWKENRSGDFKVTENELQNEYFMSHFCEIDNDTTIGDWKLKYRIMGSDGLEVLDVRYKDKPVIKSAKIVDWHVSYLNKKEVGYSDAIGCPMFSAAAVVAFNGPSVEKLSGQNESGFALVQDFRSPIWPAMCNYRYQNRLELYDDGSFRIMGINHGQGCNDSAVYKPIFRIDLDLGGNADQCSQWDGKAWKPWDKEQWTDQNAGKFTREGYWFKLTNDKGKGYYLLPDRGQYGKRGRGDAAFAYISKFKKDIDEGVTDLPTIGDCCRYDYKQGPEQYLEPAESLKGAQLILWYVPRMYNDKRPGYEYCWSKMVAEKGKLSVKTWPGSVGPKFVPVQK